MSHHGGHDPLMSVTDELLREMICEQKETNRLLMLNDHLLRSILEAVTPKFPTSFTIQETSMIALDPGNSPQFTATPQPAGSSLGSVIPTWTSSDPVNAPITVDTTGLVATVNLSPSIAVGASVTLTVSAQDPSNPANTATGTLTFTVGAPPSQFPTSFTIAQSA